MDTMRADDDVVVTLGGHRFAVIDYDSRTVLQDHYLQTLVQDLGLDKVLPMDGEPDAAYLIRMQNAVIRSGRAHELIAGYLLPEGMTNAEWDRATAKATAKHIGSLSTEEDRDAVIGLAMDAVFGFFRSGLRLWQRSLARLQPAIPSEEQVRH